MNNKTTTTYIFIFALIIFSCQISVSARHTSIKTCEKHEKKSMTEPNQGWKIVKADKNDEPTWIIYSRKIEGTNFYEYKIEGDIQSSPEACIASFKQDIHNLASGAKSKKYPIYNIVEESEEGLLTYVIHKEPFPLKNTEMSVRYNFFNEADGSIGVRWHEAWEECTAQPTKKLSRVQSFRGTWNFSPTSDNACKAVNSVQFDPQKMPMWLVEPMVVKFLKGGLKDIRNTVEPPKIADYSSKNEG